MEPDRVLVGEIVKVQGDGQAQFLLGGAVVADRVDHGIAATGRAAHDHVAIKTEAAGRGHPHLPDHR